MRPMYDVEGEIAMIRFVMVYPPGGSPAGGWAEETYHIVFRHAIDLRREPLKLALDQTTWEAWPGRHGSYPVLYDFYESPDLTAVVAEARATAEKMVQGEEILTEDVKHLRWRG